MATIREIALDTETTGLDPRQGHRIIEIGCVEMRNRVRTGEAFHVYINPERDVPEGAFKVHGISTEFLQDKPLFGAVVDEFLKFIGNDKLIIHNAAFDMRFLNYELERAKKPKISNLRAEDTLAMARKKYPGSQANLDALCRRFNIDLSKRDKHGALLDAELLAEVYLELMGGRQTHLGLDSTTLTSDRSTSTGREKRTTRPFREPRPFRVSEEELAAHAEFIKGLKGTLWA
jgi:DNA polymerase-3 subunit epsilon